jgi:hypothetical protein
LRTLGGVEIDDAKRVETKEYNFARKPFFIGAKKADGYLALMP